MKIFICIFYKKKKSQMTTTCISRMHVRDCKIFFFWGVAYRLSMEGQKPLRFP